MNRQSHQMFECSNKEMGEKPNLSIDSAIKCQLCRNRLQRIAAQTYKMFHFVKIVRGISRGDEEGTKWKYLMIILVYCKTMNGWWWWRWWWSTSLTWIILQRHFTFFLFSPKISLIHLNAVKKESVHVSEWEKKCAKPEARNTNARLKYFNKQPPKNTH